MSKLLKRSAPFIILFMVSFAIRIFTVTSQSLRNDELWTIWFCSTRYIKSFVEMLYIANIKFLDIPPLYLVFMRGWVRLFGDGELSVRLPSVIFGALSIPLFYRVAKKFVSNKVSVISTILLIFLPIHIHYSQEARNYSLFFYLSLLSMHFFIQTTTKKDGRSIMGYVLSTALMVYCHYFGIFLILAQSIYSATKIKDRSLCIKTLSLLFLSLSPLLIPIILRQNSSVEVVGTWIKRIGIWNGLKSELFFYSPYAAGIPINYIFIILFAIGIVHHLWLIFKTNSREWLLILWFVIPISIPLVLSQFISPFFVERYAIIALAPFILYVTKGLTAAVKNNVILALLLIVFMFLPFQQDRARTPSENFENWRKVSPYILNKNIPTLLIPETPATRMGLEYYMGKGTWHLINSKVACKKDFIVVSKYEDNKLDLPCKYSKIVLDDSGPPYVFRYKINEVGTSKSSL